MRKSTLTTEPTTTDEEYTHPAPRDIRPDGRLFIEQVTHRGPWNDPSGGVGYVEEGEHITVIVLETGIEPHAGRLQRIQTASFRGHHFGETPQPRDYRQPVTIQTFDGIGSQTVTLSWSAIRALFEAAERWAQQHPDQRTTQPDDMSSEVLPF